MAKDNSTYEAYLEEVRSKLPEDKKEAFEQLVGTDVGKELFGGHLREADYYRRLNEMHAEKEALKEKEAEWGTWYQDNVSKQERMIAERDALKARLDGLRDAAGLEGDDPTTPPRKAPVEQDDSVKKEIETLKTQLGFMDKALPRLMKDYGQVNYDIVKGNWNLNPGDVLDLALSKGVDLQSAFSELTAKERDERAKAEREKLIKDSREEGRREALKQTPSPDRLRPSGPTIVDSLQDKKIADPRNRIDGAVSAWLDGINDGAGAVGSV